MPHLPRPAAAQPRLSADRSVDCSSRAWARPPGRGISSAAAQPGGFRWGRSRCSTAARDGRQHGPDPARRRGRTCIASHGASPASFAAPLQASQGPLPLSFAAVGAARCRVERALRCLGGSSHESSEARLWSPGRRRVGQERRGGFDGGWGCWGHRGPKMHSVCQGRSWSRGAGLCCRRRSAAVLAETSSGPQSREPGGLGPDRSHGTWCDRPGLRSRCGRAAGRRGLRLTSPSVDGPAQHLPPPSESPSEYIRASVRVALGRRRT